MRKKITLSIFLLLLLCASFITASAASSTVNFEVSQLTVGENGIDDTFVNFRVRRTGDLSEAATVDITRVDGTTDEFDFFVRPGTMEFAPGVSEVVGTINIREDSVYERTEWFALSLSSPSPNMRLGSQHTMTVSIDDVDDYPKMYFIRLGMKVEPGPGRQVQTSVCIASDHSSVEPISVSFSTSDVTATAGTDYVATSGTLTFEPWPYHMIKCVPMTILGDGLNEPRETLRVNLLNPVNAGISPYPGFFTIINNLPYPQQIDTDGDGFADPAGYNSTAANWFTHQYTNGIVFGTSTDVIVPADYTGDGQTDTAFWRPATGDWYVLRSEDGSYYSVHFGTTGDIPVPADFDADGIADFAVFRPSTGTWYVQRSGNGSVDVVVFGSEGDRPAPADFDGDWKADLAVYRPNAAAGSEWWIKRSSDSGVSVTRFGEASDRTTAADYTGDGKTDISVWRPATGQWFVLRSEDNSYYIQTTFPAEWGVPAPGDYTGDGRSDYASFLPIYHNFHVWPSNPDPNASSGGGGTDPSVTVPLATVNVH